MSGAAIAYGIVGLLLLLGGVKLALLGGSFYYLIAAISFLATAVLLWRRSAWAALLYCWFLLGTIVWSVTEVGLDPWALMPRLGMPSVMGLWFALPLFWRSVVRGPQSPLGMLTAKYGAAILFLGAVALLAASLWRTSFVPAAPRGDAVAINARDAPQEWIAYGNSNRGDRFSTATQINRGNVANLQPAWRYRYSRPDSPKPGGASAFEATPLKIGDALFFCTAGNEVISLDIDTGHELWRFNPKADVRATPLAACRGVSYYSKTGSGALCDARIFEATFDDRLIAVDLKTGTPCRDFGESGTVNLLDNIGPSYPGNHYSSSPPLVVGRTVIIGSLVLDGQSTDSPPGVIRAYDAQTGKPLWGWDVLDPKGKKVAGPQQLYARNSPNAWSVFSADEALGLIYVPTGNAPPDYFGGLRTPEQERYNASVVAIDVATGDVRWSFQTTHHDLWDYDVPSQPVVMDLQSPLGPVPALIVPTKRGEIFVLDRRTGRPIFPVEERPAPAGILPGERYAPTQPHSTALDFSPARLIESDMWGATTLDQMLCRISFRQNRYVGQFTPPGLDPSIAYPGLMGMMNWGSVAVDPERQIMIVNTTMIPVLLRVLTRQQIDDTGLRPYGEPAPAGVPRSKRTGVFEGIGDVAVYPQAGAPYGAQASPFLSRIGFPCNRPSWGDIAAVDLRTSKIIWKRPFGTTRDAAPLGIALPTGVPNVGGAALTRAGIAFIGAAIDNYIRGFDIETGQELWRSRLPAGGQATPMTYVSAKTGKQYVVIASGGHASLKTKLGDFVVAFALPPNQ